jgi:hypothetical protein
MPAPRTAYLIICAQFEFILPLLLLITARFADWFGSMTPPDISANFRTVIGMMARDEDTRLEAWILYHARLVGFDNLYIFDNGSVSARVKDLLWKYERKGANVDYHHTGRSDFERKGEVLASLFQRLEKTRPGSLFIPLDCDEFLVLGTANGGITLDPSVILEYLSSLSQEKRILVARDAHANVLGQPGTFFPAYRHHKIFFASGSCQSMDKGFHATVERAELPELETRILYLHFHYRLFDDMVRQSQWKLESQVDIGDPTKLSTYKGPGEHVLRYLSMTENNYANGFKKTPPNAVHIAELVPYLMSIGVGEDFFSSI